MSNKVWIIAARLKDKTPLNGPFTTKPSGTSIEFVINDKSYWVESTVKEFTDEQKAEVDQWIRKKMKVFE